MKMMYPIRWSMIARGCLVAGVAAAALDDARLQASVHLSLDRYIMGVPCPPGPKSHNIFPIDSAFKPKASL